MYQTKADIALRHLHLDVARAGECFIALVLITSALISSLWAQGETKRGNLRPGASPSATEVAERDQHARSGQIGGVCGPSYIDG
jgi:hypothetical protein